ncbi:DUF1629 domain-containing protein [uncultured Maribacter sp.]|uniref:imm11 family protein n=1 Tax=uncultured Maribacter sp. TaxID=431308 RepID=UPI00261967AD|nr:DUF1629 domain-containing protein [uncultured Maribacter sp.]
MYRLSDFYKRDTYFVFNNEYNLIDRFDLINSKIIEAKEPIRFDVDKIDDYISEYDILPTFTSPLVSTKFKNTFEDLIGKNDAQFLSSTIFDEKGNKNDSFYVFNILKTIPMLDKERSIYEVDEDGFYSIKKAYFIPDGLKTSIARMEEHKSYIIVKEEFKRRCEEANLKGVNFIEEGHTIYTDL